MIPPARISVVLAARSEFVRFLVINPEFAAFRVAGMKALTREENLNGCVDAIITPQAGARVEYRRGDKNYFRIRIDGPSNGGPAFLLRTTSAEARELTQSVVFEASDDCGDSPNRLPVWGPAQFGDILRPPGINGSITPGILYDGKLSVYARAHDRLIGISFPPSIYLVNSFELPTGSVLSAPIFDASSTWIGSVSVEKTTSGFKVQAEGQARQIVLRTAGTVGGPRDSGEPVDLGNYAQFLNDPNIVRIQFLVTAFLVLANFSVRLLSFLDSSLFSSAKRDGLKH
jgi:hypothetical protein